MDQARLHAESAIRNSKHSVALQKLAANIEAVSDRISSAMMMQGVAEQLGRAIPMIHGVVTGMDKLGMGQSMEQFQRVFEDLEVQTASMTQGMEGVYAGSTDQSEVDRLMNQVAEEQNLQIGNALGSAGTGALASGKAAASKPADSLAERLNNLKQICEKLLIELNLHGKRLLI
eukprot:TRINITY_DN12794_c0_g1_i3.p1 TRINITY_DN12794_c0_g1~~TRINITY_DN12794_c0_g1_i3.p1  ORF type:complete len:174 (-),score=39.20 TRINITY_DN12794_c0_g1_i3:155-676(-)